MEEEAYVLKKQDSAVKKKKPKGKRIISGWWGKAWCANLGAVQRYTAGMDTGKANGQSRAGAKPENTERSYYGQSSGK